ncbi:MAG: GtrA family protein [Clostridia bacterium]|nr:GtrA family protein [Clostridia bacterium]
MMIKKLLDKSFLKFLAVGVVNTLVSMVLMFLLEKLGYWPSTTIAYLVGACVSFFLNKNFTFKSSESTLKSGLKFALIVAICFLFSYSLAQPIAGYMLKYIPLSPVWTERITKLFGMGLYTLTNYSGQKFFAFKTKK